MKAKINLFLEIFEKAFLFTVKNSITIYNMIF